MSKVKNMAKPAVSKDKIITDFEVKASHQDGTAKAEPSSLSANLKYMLAGVLFGVVLIKSEVVSWFRIQEMFRLESFHMYGVIGTAVVVGIISVYLIKKLKIKTLHGDPITFDKKEFRQGQVWGGLIFGIGWAITGACPGPLFAQFGSGVTVIGITILSAIAGTWVYSKFREKLPL